MHERGIGWGFELAVSAGEDGVRLRGDGGRLREGQGNEEGARKQYENWLHGISPFVFVERVSRVQNSLWE